VKNREQSILQSEDAAQAASQAKIDLAKKSFIGKVAIAALAAVGLGLAVASTVLSGGTGLPLVALAGAVMLVSIADASCAFADWQLKKNGDEKGLVMGGDCLAQPLYALLHHKFGVSEERSKLVANIFSTLTRVGLAAGTTFAGVGGYAVASIPGKLGVVMTASTAAHKTATDLVSKMSSVYTAPASDREKNARKEESRLLKSRITMLEQQLAQTRATQTPALTTDAEQDNGDNPPDLDCLPDTEAVTEF
jgi:secreted effector protein SseF